MARRTGAEGGSLGSWEQICLFLRAHPAKRALCSWELVPASLLTTNRSLPSLSFSSPLRKRPFSEFVLLHPPPPQIRVSYSHFNRCCSPTECRSVARYTVPQSSRPLAIHFLTNFLLTCILPIFRVTAEFGLNWRRIC